MKSEIESASGSERPALSWSAGLRRRLDRLVDEVADVVVAERRDFHRHAETGWLEFRTASLIARRLADLGLHVAVGPKVIDDEARMGVPEPEVLEAAWTRAHEQGGDTAFLEALRGGFTGVVGTCGNADGPTIGLRFDIDALDLVESEASDHRPAAQGFASVNRGATHACGHDAHAAIGLGVARVLTGLADAVQGRVKLIFQPAEEGVRGARSMVAAGVVDDVDLLLTLHVYSGWPTGEVVAGRDRFMATTKFDVRFKGEPAHAGGCPHEGNNALLAAATAALNLHAIPRHADGSTRINVGRLVAGEGRNVIPPCAEMAIETRGSTSALNDYMYGSAMRVVRAAAEMYNCGLELREMGGAPTATSDAALTAKVLRVVEALPELTLRTPEPGGGSEDYTYMMRRVQEHGGLATRASFGAYTGRGHHTAKFDIDERALPLAVKFLTALVIELQTDSVT